MESLKVLFWAHYYICVFVLSLKLVGLSATYFTFADDTALVYSHTCLHTLTEEIMIDLDLYYKWLLSNGMKLNISKTKYMVFKQKNKKLGDIDLSVGNVRLERVETVTYLGLVINENLSWGKHIAHIENLIKPMISAIYKFRNSLDRTTKLRIYNTYYLSVMRYLIVIWGSCYDTNFNEIVKLQGKILKIMFNLDYYTSKTEVFQMLKVKSMLEIRSEEQLKLAFKLVNRLINCNSDIVSVQDIHGYDKRETGNMYHPSSRTNVGLMNPLRKSLLMYNSLPSNVKSIDKYSKFVQVISG